MVVAATDLERICSVTGHGCPSFARHADRICLCGEIHDTPPVNGFWSSGHKRSAKALYQCTLLLQHFIGSRFANTGQGAWSSAQSPARNLSQRCFSAASYFNSPAQHYSKKVATTACFEEKSAAMPNYFLCPASVARYHFRNLCSVVILASRLNSTAQHVSESSCLCLEHLQNIVTFC